MYRQLALPFLIAALALGACSSDDPTGPGQGPGEPTPVPVATVELPAAPDVLTLGQSVRLVAVPKSAAGQPLSNRPVTWSSSDHDIAAVDEDGVLTAVSEGSATVTATSEGKKAQHVVRVVTVAPVVAEVIILGDAQATLRIGQALQLEAQARDAQGAVIGGRTITWTSTNLDAATVTAGGLVTAGFTGSARIIAAVEGFADTLALDVIPTVARVAVTPGNVFVAPGQTAKLDASAYGADEIQLNVPITWRSSDASVVSVAADGRITAHGTGRVTITATAEGIEGQATVNVATARDFDAVQANGAPLPTDLFTVPVEGGTARYVAQSGTLRILGGRYEQTFAMLVFLPGRPMIGGTFTASGEALRDVLTGDWIFIPDGGARPQFRGVLTDDGLVVTQRYLADASEATVTYLAR